MEFRILGPLEVWDDDGEVSLGGHKPRALLALLLLQSNQVVPADRLIDELWGEDSPEGAAAALRVNVSRLRKTLPKGVLTTRSPGYLVRVDGDELDLGRFERLVEEGRSLLARGLAEDAAERFRYALSLWRGPALADFAYENFAQATIARLEEIRLGAVELRIDADLALGRHDELAGELEALIAEHPLRERLRGQLMLARYQSGRQAEALDAYRDARRALVDELGIEPSPALQELERAILRQEPALGPARVPRSVGEAAERSNLPFAASRLIGRRREVAAALEVLRRDDVRLVTLTGPGGVGKTRLALEVAAELEPEIDDGVFWVPLAALRDSALVVPTIAQVCGAASEPSERIGAQRMLLVLDNFEHLPDAAIEVASLLAACPNLQLLVTSRERLQLAGEYEYPVPPLAPAEGVELFTDRARALRSGFEPDPAVVRLCERLDYLPLALELAAARTKVLTPAQLVDRLGERLDLFEGGRDADPRQQSLRTTIEWSYDLLADTEKDLFARLSVFVGSWTLAAAQEVCGADVHSVASLVDKSLAHPGDGRFRLLETVREYAGEKLDDQGARESTVRALAEYLLGLGEGFEGPLTSSQLQAGRALMGDHLDDLRVAIDWAIAAEETDLALKLALAARFAPACLTSEMSRWLNESLRDRSSHAPRILAEGLLQSGRVASMLGEQEKSRALLVESLRLFQEHGEERDLVRVLNTLGVVATSEGDHGRARALFNQSLELATRHADDTGVIRATNHCGELELTLGNLASATEFLERSADLARRVGDEMLLGNSLHGLGDVALVSGDTLRAGEYYSESLSISRRFHDAGTPAYSVAGLAAVAALEGDVVRAGRLWGSVTVLERAGGRPLLPYERTRYEEAIKHCSEAAPDAFEAALERGRRMSAQETFEFALAGVSALEG